MPDANQHIWEVQYGLWRTLCHLSGGGFQLTGRMDCIDRYCHRQCVSQYSRTQTTP